MNADIPTMLLMIIVTAVVMAGSVFIVAWGQPAEGLRRWAAALLVHALGFILVALRGRIPDLYSVVVANGLLSTSFALMFAAVCQYQARRASPWLTVSPVLFTLAAYGVLIDDQPGRVILSGVVYSAQIVLVIATLLDRRHGRIGRGAFLIVAALGLVTLMLIVRSSSTAAGWVRMDSLTVRSTVQTISFMMSLVAALATSIGFVFMIKERADEKNRVMASQDPLTGAANRRSIIGALDRDMTRAMRNRQPLSVLMIDIDHFKTVNDVYGHLAGDRVLRGVVDVLLDRVRAQDMVGRYGGEEFMVLLPDTWLEGARQVAEKLRQGVAGKVHEIEGQRVSVTVSIGVCGGAIGSHETWDHLIQEADAALYRAKEGGRNRVEVAEDVLPQTPFAEASRPAALELRRVA
jgi:diguanylate cyclase (GGDEF)-like protein